MDNQMGYAQANNYTEKQFRQPVAAPDGPMSPFALAGAAYQNTAELCHRLREMADRLCGPTPQQVQNGAGTNTAASPPTFIALGHDAEITMSDVQSAMEALNRIERLLP